MVESMKDLKEKLGLVGELYAKNCSYQDKTRNQGQVAFGQVSGANLGWHNNATD